VHRFQQAGAGIYLRGEKATQYLDFGVPQEDSVSFVVEKSPESLELGKTQRLNGQRDKEPEADDGRDKQSKQLLTSQLGSKLLLQVRIHLRQLRLQIQVNLQFKVKSTIAAWAR
jgi:hypothetical protein